MVSDARLDTLAGLLAVLNAAGVRKAEFSGAGDALTSVEFRDPEPPAPEKVEPQGSVFVDDVDAAAHFLASRERGKSPP